MSRRLEERPTATTMSHSGLRHDSMEGCANATALLHVAVPCVPLHENVDTSTGTLLVTEGWPESCRRPTKHGQTADCPLRLARVPWLFYRPPQ